MNIYNRFKHLSVLIGFVFVAVCMYIFINSIKQIVYDSFIDNIQEISSHDIKTIEGLLDKSWEELFAIQKRLEAQKPKTIFDLQMFLINERATSDFDCVYLLTKDGDIYTDTFTFYPVAKQYVWSFFGESRGCPFVCRYTDVNSISEEQKTTLLYGIHIPKTKIQGVEFTGVTGRTKLSSIQTKLKIDSFGGQGHSVTIDMAGECIVGTKKAIGMNQKENLFEILKSGKILDSFTIDNVIFNMNQKEAFDIRFINSSGQEESMFFLPMTVAPWYYVMIVPNEVFVSQSKKLILTNIITMFIVGGVILLLLLLLFFSRKKTLHSQAQATARAEFLSNMSHEIRTPLNGLIGLNHLMTTHINEKEKLCQYLKQSQSTSQYLLSLLNDVLDVSKLQAGKVEIENAPYDINSMIENVTSIQKDNMAQRQIVFTTKKQIFWKDVIGDRTRTAQILMNLLSNAAKFTPKGGSVDFEIVQHVLLDGRIKTKFCVKDTGCGITAEFQKHIFESFSQERGKIQQSQQGTGLGLSISYMLATLMSGTLEVQSKVGVGSAFTLDIPTKIATNEDLATKAPPPLPAEKQKADDLQKTKKQNLCILIAEDNDLNAEILQEILQDLGHKTVIAKDGAQVVETFAVFPAFYFDLILMDVQMPVMSGYEAARAIRGLSKEDSKSICIIACTANTFKEDKERAKESGMNDFLSKPIQINDLTQKLQKLL